MDNLELTVNAHALWLGELVPQAQMEELQQLCSEAHIASLPHPRFVLPHSLIGERGFVPPDRVEGQAYMQVLAHAGCIPSCLLFGFSLCSYPLKSKRVLSELHAYEYMYLGIESILQNHTDGDFLDEATFIFDSTAFMEICSFIIQQGRGLGFKQDNDAVVDFAKICFAGMTAPLKRN